MISICKVAPAWNDQSNVSGTLLANSTSQQSSFQKILDDFRKMHKAKAYLHWYTGEGMDSDEFSEAASNLEDLISEYQQYE